MSRDIDLGGLDNIFDNAVKNIKELFKLYQGSEIGIRFRQIYDEKISIPEPRSIAVDLVGQSLKLRSWIGKTKRNFTVIMTFDIWYFHEQPETDARKKEVQSILWKISQMFTKHSSVNGFCDPLRCEVLGIEYQPRLFGDKIMAGGLVRLQVNKLHTVLNVD
jgi:hypothetical protein